MQGMIEAVRGCLKEELRIDVIANNLANASVPGFKKDKVSFQNLLLQQASGSSAKGNQVRNTALVRIKTDMSQGDIRFTGNMLDIAINGKGFFKVMTPDGIRYTRKGNFTLDSLGNLITPDGFQVLGKGGGINLLDKQVEIDDRGRIIADGTELGQLDIVTFVNTDGLVKMGDTLFAKGPNITEEPLPPETTIRQGYLEGSNVNIAEEMVQMIHSLRAFESYQRAIKVLDHLDNKVTNEVAKVR